MTLFTILTKNASFRSYSILAYLLRVHILNLNMRMYITIVHSCSVDPRAPEVVRRRKILHSTYICTVCHTTLIVVQLTFCLRAYSAYIYIYIYQKNGAVTRINVMLEILKLNE